MGAGEARGSQWCFAMRVVSARALLSKQSERSCKVCACVYACARMSCVCVCSVCAWGEGVDFAVSGRLGMILYSILYLLAGECM